MKSCEDWSDLGHHSQWSVVGHILGFLFAASRFKDQIHLSQPECPEGGTLKFQGITQHLYSTIPQGILAQV